MFSYTSNISNYHYISLLFENVQNIIIGTYLSVNDREQRLVGHVPTELSFLLCKFLACDGCRLEFTPTGPRYLEDGLVVPGRFQAISNKTALIRILKDELQTKADKEKHANVNEVKTMNKISYLKNLSHRLVQGGGVKKEGELIFFCFPKKGELIRQGA